MNGTSRAWRAVAFILVLSLLTASRTAHGQSGSPDLEPWAVRPIDGAPALLFDQPGVHGVIVASLPADTEVFVTGPEIQRDGLVWRPVRDMAGREGFIRADLLTQISRHGAQTQSSQPGAGNPSPTGLPSGGSVSSGASVPEGSVSSRNSVPSGSVGAAPSTQPGPGAPVGQTRSASAPQPTERQQAPAPTTNPTVAPSPVPETDSAASDGSGQRTVTVRRAGRDVQTSVLTEASAPDGNQMREGSLIVKFRSGTSENDRNRVRTAMSMRTSEPLLLADTFRVTVDQSRVSDVLSRYSAHPEIEYAEPDYVMRASLTPNDPLFGSQYGPQKISAPTAWNTAQSSSNIRIAVVDCGIFTSSSAFLSPDGFPGHPDVRSKIVGEVNFTSSPFGADDFCDHGTSVAGIAAAATNNGVGIAGVGFNASILNAKVLGDNGSGSSSAVINGIVWAADNGAHVINLSLGSTAACSAATQDAINYAWNKNAVIVAAAGNENRNSAGQPASCTRVVGVAATDSNDNRASFSNYGLNVDIAAPGVGIRTTDLDGNYDTYNGTSHSSPHVAGVAALVWGTAFGTSNAAVVDRILSSADQIAGTGTTYKWGRLNAAAAVAAPPPPGACPSPRPPVKLSTAVTNSATQQTTTTITAGVGVVRSLQFGAGVNASIDAGGNEKSSGNFTFATAGNSAVARFDVRPASIGSAVTVPLVVVDDCGPWSTLVGAGANALAPKTVTVTVTNSTTSSPLSFAQVELNGGFPQFTSGSGQVSFSNVSNGNHSIQVSSFGFTTKTQTFVVGGGSPIVSVAVALVPTTGTLTGTVTNAATGQPVQSATVRDQVSFQQTQTNASGQFTLTGIPPGSRTIVTSATGLATDTRIVNVVAGSNPPLSIALAVPGTILVTVTNSVTTNPIFDALVLVDSTFGGWTNPAGQVTVTGITPGNHTLSVSAPGFTTDNRTINVVSGANAVSVALTP